MDKKFKNKHQDMFDNDIDVGDLVIISSKSGSNNSSVRLKISAYKGIANAFGNAEFVIVNEDGLCSNWNNDKIRDTDTRTLILRKYNSKDKDSIPTIMKVDISNLVKNYINKETADILRADLEMLEKVKVK
jgi:hypothetical protein